ncbi:MAG: CopG family antitoxin [Caldilineaceae bacterium]
MADFWDTHSTADYDDVTQEVSFEVLLGAKHKPITLLPELSSRLEAAAQGRGVSVETLVNVWLTEKVLAV